MSNNAVCETNMKDHQLILEAVNETLKSIIIGATEGLPDDMAAKKKAELTKIIERIIKNIKVATPRQIGKNMISGEFGINAKTGVDIKISKADLVSIMIPRMEQEVRLMTCDAVKATERGDLEKAKAIKTMIGRVNAHIAQLKSNPWMYADVGFAFDPEKKTYAYTYDNDYDFNERTGDYKHASGFGASFSDEISKAYAALEQKRNILGLGLGVTPVGNMDHRFDNNGDPAFGQEMEVDEDLAKAAVEAAGGVWEGAAGEYDTWKQPVPQSF
jgi:hypothetical protein